MNQGTKKLQVSLSAKKPSLAEAKKILKENEKAQTKARNAKAKTFRAKKDAIQKEINTLLGEKDEALANISSQQKQLKLLAAETVDKFDAKVAKLNAKLEDTQAKAMRVLKIKPKDMKNVQATNV